MDHPDLITALAAYLPWDRALNIIQGSPLSTNGVALIADISGFTPLTEALTHGLSDDQGAEELTRALDGVFTPLIAEIHAYRGSVIKFGGDALIVWFGQAATETATPVLQRALSAAWRMQQAIKVHGQVPTPIGLVTLKMKVGLAYGTVKRFSLGRNTLGLEDVLGGYVLDQMAHAEHHAEPGDIMVAGPALAHLPANWLPVLAWRNDVAVAGKPATLLPPQPWPPLKWSAQETNALVAALTPYVPAAIAQTLAQGRRQLAELKPVISLFVQFHGIDYDNDPDVADRLQQYFQTAQQIARQYGGRVNRLITGDKGSLLHVIFGAPLSVEDQEIRAVRCALDLQADCGQLPFISMQRIGIGAGRVFAGPIGAPNRHDYTTMGDAINLSARLMQNAADDQILTTQAIAAYLNDDFVVEILGQIKVKGKAAPIKIATPLAYQPRRRAAQSPVDIPLFGRESQLAALEKMLLHLRQTGQGGVVRLVGEVGMGKTHLLRAFRQAHDGPQSAPIRWAEGIALAYGQTLSGYLFIEILRDLLNLPTDAQPTQTATVLRDFCGTLFEPDAAARAFPYLANLLGLSLDDVDEKLQTLNGESRQWRLFEVVKTMFTRLAARQPLALIFDDLQWVDATSAALIETITPLAKTSPILLLLATRPDQQSPAPNPKTIENSIVLPPLKPQAGQALVEHIAGHLPNDVLTTLVNKGDGNPLFLAELARAVAAQQANAAAGVTIDAGALPNSIQGLLLAQIDRLALEARHTLQMGAVIGREFLHRVLAALAGGEASIDAALQALQSEAFIGASAHPTAQTGYIFRHILIQESAYNTLLYQRRRAYHRQVAQILTDLFPVQQGIQLGRLAYHYEQAEAWPEAIYYTLQAADQARLLYAHHEAVARYQHALTLLQDNAIEDDKQQATIHFKLAQVYAARLDFNAAQTHYNQAFNLQQRQMTATPPQPAQSPVRWPVWSHGPLTLDPGLSEVNDVSEVVYDLFEGLVALDDDLNIMPNLAQRWRVSDNGRRYRFKLRPDLRWNDGRPLTAGDVVFAWQRNLHPQTNAGMAALLYPVSGAVAWHQGQSNNPNTLGIRAIDDHTLEITLSAPSGHFLYLLSHPITFPLPAHVISRNADWTTATPPVCNGPFQVSGRGLQGQVTQLSHNPHYHGLRGGNIHTVELAYHEPNETAYQAANVDYYRLEDRPATDDEFGFAVQYFATIFVGFANNHPLTGQRQFRAALAQAIDQTALVEAVWGGMQRAATGGMVPAGIPGHSPDIGHPFDPVRARANLRATGVSGQHAPSLTLAAFPGLKTTPDFLQDSWATHLGFRVNVLKDLAIDEILGRLNRGEIEMVLLSWELDYPHPDSILRVLFHSQSPVNPFGWVNNTFDRLITTAHHAPTQQARLGNYHQADQLLTVTETAALPLYYQESIGILRPGLSLSGKPAVIRGGRIKLKNLIGPTP